MSTLANIRTKVRRLTGRPSPQQITDAQIDEYIDTAYLYDMPETLRLVTQETTFEFMTEANVATYDMETMQVFTYQDPSTLIDQYENAVDVYITLMQPAYVAGYQCFFSQDRQQFLGTYPELAQITSSVLGNGMDGPYTTTLSNTPILQNSVTVGAIDSTNSAVNCVDVPTDRTDGTWKIINSNTVVTGTINYITGALSVTFANAIPSGNTVTFTAVPYAPNRPQAMLFYDNIITLRPVPDQSYKVTLGAYKRPTVLINSSSSPQLKQWWQYLAYLASKKIFEDSADHTSVQELMPGLKEQEDLVLRRTIIERTQQRTSTIYTEEVNLPYGNFQSRF